MKRRLPRDVKYAQADRSKRPIGEVIHHWISKEKQRTHKRERREGLADIQTQRKEEY